MADYGSQIKDVPDNRPYDNRDEPCVEAPRETSLEEDLEVLERHYRELQVVMANIAGTKKRIESKNDQNGMRIGKLYEAVALTLRGEASAPRAEW